MSVTSGGSHDAPHDWALVTLALGFLVGPLTAQTQQTMRVYRIGWLSAGPAPPGPSVQIQAFLQGLHDLGYVEGQNLVMEYRYAAGSAERLRDLAAELVGLPVDVIVAVGASGTRGAQHATRPIPIVMAGASDPAGQGLDAPLPRAFVLVPRRLTPLRGARRLPIPHPG